VTETVSQATHLQGDTSGGVVITGGYAAALGLIARSRSSDSHCFFIVLFNKPTLHLV
jgi:hypothetical protein